MSNPLQELKKLLSPQTVVETGTVLSVEGSIRVSTSGGVRVVTSSIPLHVGECVLIRGGSVQSKAKRQDELPTYYL